MKILLTGASGQLGQTLVRICGPEARLAAFARDDLDIRDKAAIVRAIGETGAQIVVNAAAYTAVDRAEAEAETAFAVNRDGARNVAEASAEAGSALIHISTDFVFDGKSSKLYEPDDAPAPLGVYGASKRAGEIVIGEALPNALLIRTSWLYSIEHRSFAKTILDRLGKTGSVRVVADQYGTPTGTIGLAGAILAAARCIEVARHGRATAPRGIRHFADEGVASWYDLAVAIRDEGVRRRLLPQDADVVPISTEDYPTSAKRPAFSALDSALLRRELNLPPSPWREALARQFDDVFQTAGTARI